MKINLKSLVEISNTKIWFGMFLVLGVASACSSVSYVKTGDSTDQTHAPVKAEKVKVYRTLLPEGIKLKEIGMLSFSGEYPQMDKIYVKLREEAGKRGATHVVKVKLVTHLETTSDPITTCSGTPPVCTTTYVTTVHLVYVVTGTLMKSEENEKYAKLSANISKRNSR